MKLVLDQTLNCKSKNIIYVAQCQVCSEKKKHIAQDISTDASIAQCPDTYFGQTVTEAHVRFNGHRSKFKVDDKLSYSKSALAQHCFDEHYDQFSLSVFRIGLVKRCSALDLDREETRFINKFRTELFGINRIKVGK